jgi:hypothetical protein
MRHRYQLTLYQQRGRWSAFASRREMVAADGGSTDQNSPIWKLRKGAPLCVRGSAAVGKRGGAGWVEALLVGKPAGVSGMVDVLLASGDRTRVAARDVRVRSGEAHPVAAAIGESRGRVARYNDRAATTIQRLARARKARRQTAALRSGENVAVAVAPSPTRAPAKSGGASKLGRSGGGGKRGSESGGGGGGSSVKLLAGLVPSEAETKAAAEEAAAAERALAQLDEESVGLKVQLARLKKLHGVGAKVPGYDRTPPSLVPPPRSPALAPRCCLWQELGAIDVSLAEAEAPKGPDPEEQKRVLDGLVRRRDHLSGMMRAVIEGSEAVAREQAAVNKALDELTKVQTSVPPDVRIEPHHLWSHHLLAHHHRWPVLWRFTIPGPRSRPIWLLPYMAGGERHARGEGDREGGGEHAADDRDGEEHGLGRAL